MNSRLIKTKFFKHLDLDARANFPTTPKFPMLIFFQSNKNEKQTKTHTHLQRFVVVVDATKSTNSNVRTTHQHNTQHRPAYTFQISNMTPPSQPKFTVTYVSTQATISPRSIDTIHSTRKINSSTIICVPIYFFSSVYIFFVKAVQKL